MKYVTVLTHFFAVGAFAVASMSAAFAESRLDKVKREKKIVVGARESSHPYGFNDASGNWVGWSMDLAKSLHEIIQKKLAMQLALEFKPVTPQTRIPLIVNGTVDAYFGSAGKSVDREQVVDFSLTNNTVCIKKLVPKNSDIRDTNDLAGKRVGVTKGSLEERLLITMSENGRLKPAVKVVPYDKHSTGFIALSQGKTDAHVTAEDQLLSLAMQAPNPSEWEVRGPDMFCTLSGIILPRNDSDWRNMVNHSLCYFIVSGGYDKLYNEWFAGPSPKAGYQRPMSAEMRLVIQNQCPEGSDAFIEAAAK